MKKIVALILTAILLVSVFAIPSSATTKADLLARVKTSPVYKYIKPGIENAYNTVTITDAQAAQLAPLVEEFLKIVPADIGQTAANFRGDGKTYYSLEQIDQVTNLIKQACAILGWKFVPHLKTTDSTHQGDYVFYIYDQNNVKIFEYDGDLIQDKPVNTSGDVIVPVNTYLICGSVLVAASICQLSLKKHEQIGLGRKEIP